MPIGDAVFLATQLLLSARGAVRVTRCRVSKVIRRIRDAGEVQ
jgi:hypothetical protein